MQCQRHRLAAERGKYLQRILYCDETHTSVIYTEIQQGNTVRGTVHYVEIIVMMRLLVAALSLTEGNTASHRHNRQENKNPNSVEINKETDWLFNTGKPYQSCIINN